VVRGKPNESSYVVHTAQALAVERRVGYDELEAAIDRSAAAVFGW
jgi:Tat protein secretion system quality control protein TatD with DNase activity